MNSRTVYFLLDKTIRPVLKMKRPSPAPAPGGATTSSDHHPASVSKVNLMNKKTTRTQRLFEGKTTAGPTRFTRLSQDSDEDVMNLVTPDYPVANVIRDLVEEALHFRRLKQAGRHPAIRELLTTFDELVAARMHPLNARNDRLEAELLKTNRFLSALFVTVVEDFRFPSVSENKQLEHDLYQACAREGMEMGQIVRGVDAVSPPPPTSAPSVRPIVAQQLSDDPAL